MAVLRVQQFIITAIYFHTNVDIIFPNSVDYNPIRHNQTIN